MFSYARQIPIEDSPRTAPQRIVIANSKGGCGKTTLAVNLAAYYAMRHARTALLDYDKQASSSYWLRTRAQSRAPIHGIAAYQQDLKNVTRAWLMRLPAGTQKVVVDTPAGLSGVQLSTILHSADVVIVPVLPSVFDIQAATQFILDLKKELHHLHKSQVRIAFVANRIKSHTLSFHALKSHLAKMDIPYLANFRDTQNYTKTAQLGVSIHECYDLDVGVDVEQWVPLLRWIDDLGVDESEKMHAIH